MNRCAGPLNECVNALQEILENLIKIQQDIICSKIIDKETDCDCDATTIDGTQDNDGDADCKEFSEQNSPDKPWFCLPPAKQIEEDECLSETASQIDEEDEEAGDENESSTSTLIQSDECSEKLDKNNQKISSDDGYQRIIAVRENCDGSVSKIYALRKNIRPPKLPNRNCKQDDNYLNNLPQAESTRQSIGNSTLPGLLPDNNNIDKNSQQSLRCCKNKEKICDCPKNQQQPSARASLQPQQQQPPSARASLQPKSQHNLSKSCLLGQKNPLCSVTPSMGKNTINSTPQTLINSIHTTDSSGKNPFEELQSIIEQERKRIDYVCQQNGEKLLSSIEKEHKQQHCDHISDKGLKRGGGNSDCDLKKIICENNNNNSERRQSISSSNNNTNNNNSERRQSISSSNNNNSERRQSISSSNNNTNTEKDCKCCKNMASQGLNPKRCCSRIQQPLTETEATTLLDDMIDTTIKGFNKIAKSLKFHNLSNNSSKGSSSLNCSEIEKLKKSQEATEQKIICLRTSVHEMLVNMSMILSAKADVPEIQEMAKELDDFDCSNTNN